MTSEGSHHPGQQPDEVPPGGGGPAPYGDRPAQQDNGYGAAAPDLGWAPPPPARPDSPAPAWAGQPPQAPWGGNQSTPQPPSTSPHGWEPQGGAQTSWPAQPAQSQPAWAQGDSTPSSQPAWAQRENAAPQPGWAQGENAPSSQPAWAPSEQSQPAWAQGEPAAAPAQPAAARGAAQVPTSTARPVESWDTGAPPQQAWGDSAPDPGQPGDRPNGGPSQADSPGQNGWAAATSSEDRPQQPDWATPPSPGGAGWGTAPPAADQPAWAQAESPAWTQADQGQQAERPAWAQAEQEQAADRPAWAQAGQEQPADRPAWAQTEQGQPAARASAQVPQAGPPAPSWGTQDEPPRPGGWSPEPQDQPAWAAEQQPDRARTETWPAGSAPGEQPDWARRDDTPGDRPAQPDWIRQDEQPAWSGAAAAQQPAWMTGDDRPDAGWPAREEQGAEPTSTPPARASVSVPGAGGPPPSWNPTETAGQQPGADRAVPDVQPWSADEAWGRADSGDANSGRALDSPVYQPAPGPGISPANAVPLPPQEQRVPGASLAAAPPADFAPPAPFGDPGGPSAYDREQQSGGAGWGQSDSRHEEPQSPAGPVVPAPRTSPEAGGGRASVPAEAGDSAPAGGRAAASASVPLASRVMPPTDQGLRPGGTAPPQPRVYGRPARPEADTDQPERADQRGEHQPPRFDQPPGARFDDRDHQPSGPRFDDRDHRPGGADAFAAAPAAPPAFPPGVPSFVDAPQSNRPVNGIRPHADERQPDQFGGPADPFAGPGGGGPGSGAGAGYPPPPEPRPGADFTAAFPPAQSGQPPWSPPGVTEPEQGRFDQFKPVSEPATEAPPPKVRNGRVLAAVLVAAVLILAVPLGLLTLLGMVGDTDEPAGFDPAVGSCVKQSGQGAVAANCGEADAFTVVSKVSTKDKCADPAQPHVVLPGDGANRVLCLKPAGS